mgnify:CR=1 FL=1
MTLNNKIYDVLKWVAQIFLPALGTLYFAVAAIWGLPAAEQVLGTIVAIDAFLGALLGLSTMSYNKSDAQYDGTMNVSDTGSGTTFQLELNNNPEGLINQKSVNFKVVTDSQ